MVDSLALADRVILAGVFHSEKIPPTERLHPENVVSSLTAQDHDALLLENADAIVSIVVPRLASGDVVAILSNGGFDGIYEKLPAALRRLASRA